MGGGGERGGEGSSKDIFTEQLSVQEILGIPAFVTCGKNENSLFGYFYRVKYTEPRKGPNVKVYMRYKVTSMLFVTHLFMILQLLEIIITFTDCQSIILMLVLRISCTSDRIPSG